MAYKIDGKVTEHFTWTEVCNTKAKTDVKAVSSPALLTHARMMEHLRMLINSHTGHGCHVNSWYREKEFNKLVGGSPNSEHLDGLATDIASTSIPETLYITAMLYWKAICQIYGKIGTVGYYDWGMHFGSDGGRFGRTEFRVYDNRSTNKGETI